MPHVVILAHRHDAFQDNGYLLKEISEIWRSKGIRVSVLLGPGSHVEADLAVLHVDLTVAPPDYLAFVRRYPQTLNGDVVDTSKRHISSHLVEPGDGYEGPVIVKTDRNFMGMPEARLAAKDWSKDCRAFIQEAWHAAKSKLRRGQVGIFRDYLVFESAREVSDRVWKDPRLVVERFLPERRDGYFCVRTWLFLGDKERNARFYSKHPIVKSHNILRHEPMPEVPGELRELRRKLGFDFGKFDYTVVDGKVVLFDANRTPTFGSVSKRQILPILEELSEGIRVHL